MKQVCLLLLLTITSPAQAQLFGPESVGGALMGGALGGIIGHGNGRHGGEGAAIGAGAGFLLGAVAGQARREREAYHLSPYPVHAPAPAASYVFGGALFGAGTGALIGSASGRAGEGAAIGAGAGLVLGSLAVHDARRQQVRAWQPPAPAAIGSSGFVTQTVAAAPSAPLAPLVPLVPTIPSSPMASANALFGR